MTCDVTKNRLVNWFGWLMPQQTNRLGERIQEHIYFCEGGGGGYQVHEISEEAFHQVAKKTEKKEKKWKRVKTWKRGKKIKR